MVFRDPYILDFLGLADTYAEKDLEAAILREMESFILEMGTGFCFVARQKRMQIDNEDYYLDLLFYHRKLRRLVAIDLKIGDFQAADKGQMDLYLARLKRHSTEPGEEPPLGIILCAGKNEQHVELLEPEKSGIHVANYWMESLPKAALEQKLRDAVPGLRPAGEWRGWFLMASKIAQRHRREIHHVRKTHWLSPAQVPNYSDGCGPRGALRFDRRLRRLQLNG